MKAESLPDCPFCGRALAYGIEEGHPDGSLIHEIPWCPEFDQMDTLSFIIAVRNKLQTQKGIS